MNKNIEVFMFELQIKSTVVLLLFCLTSYLFLFSTQNIYFTIVCFYNGFVIIC